MTLLSWPAQIRIWECGLLLVFNRCSKEWFERSENFHIERLKLAMRWVPLSWSAKNKEERVAALWDQISGPNPSMTPQQFLSRIANLKASKHVIQSGDESDSDESDHDSEVQSEPEANEDIQPAQPTSQGQRKCNYCHGVPEEWKIFQCGHPICSLCAELLNSRRRPIDRKCHVCSKPIQNVIPFFPGFMEQ